MVFIWERVRTSDGFHTTFVYALETVYFIIFLSNFPQIHIFTCSLIKIIGRLILKCQPFLKQLLVDKLSTIGPSIALKSTSHGIYIRLL